jgi:hypothetical protein
MRTASNLVILGMAAVSLLAMAIASSSIVSNWQRRSAASEASAAAQAIERGRRNANAAMLDDLDGRDFSVKSEVVYSAAGGPIVVQFILTNNGSKPVTLKNARRPFHVTIHAPAKFSERRQDGGPFFGFISPLNPKPYTLEPGGKLMSETLLHHEYADIPAGSHRIAFEMQLDRARGRPVALINGSFNLTIPKSNADDDEWKKLAEEIASEAGPKHLAIFASYLKYCTSPKVVKLTLQLMDRIKSGADVSRLFRGLNINVRPVADTPPTYIDHFEVSRLFLGLYINVRPVAAIPPTVIDHLVSRGTDAAGDVFRIWFVEGKYTPADEELRKLKLSQNPYVRIMLFAARPQFYDNKEKENLLRSLDSLEYLSQDLLPDLSKFVDDLDSDSSNVRTEAARSLFEMGRLAEPALREVLETAQTVQKYEIVRDVLNAMAPNRNGTIADEMIGVLGHLKTPEAREVLEHFARKYESSWISGAAKDQFRWRE